MKKALSRWRTAGPNTNGSQFFIMHIDYPLPPSYTKFGRVTEGQDVVDEIAEVETNRNDKPVEPVVMNQGLYRGSCVRMRAVVQRVSRAKVTVDGEVVGKIGSRAAGPARRFRSRTSKRTRNTASKRTLNLRIFEDADEQDESVASRYRRRDACCFAIHSLRRYSPRPSAVIHRSGRPGRSEPALRIFRRRGPQADR